MNLDQSIKKVMATVLSVNADSITYDSTNDTFEKWDSINHMNLILALEEELGIEFTDQEIPKLLTFRLILDAVQEKIA